MTQQTEGRRLNSVPAWLYGLVWVVGCAVLLAAWLDAVSLWPIDETRYAGVAWEMLRHGQFLVPHNNGIPYPDKPPLLFWLLTGGWALFGPSIWWARLVPALFGLASLGATAFLARCLWPQRPRLVLLAPTILLGFVLWTFWTPLVMFDVLLSFWVLVAVAGVATAGFCRKRSGWLLFALGIGLGTLSKGPVAVLLVLPVALLAPLWLPAPRPQYRLWYGQVALALLVGAIIALAWAVPAALAGGDVYARAIFWGQSAGRVSESFAHAHPWWWYPSLLPLLLAPWFFWPTAWRSLARLRPGNSASVRFLLCWVVPVFIAFCAISGKQIHYLLPLLPGVALLLARALDEAPDRTATVAVMPITLLCIGLAVAVLFSSSLREVFGWPAWSAHLPRALAAAALLAGLLPLLCGRGKEQSVLAIATSVVVLVAALVWLGLPTTGLRYDLRRASDIVAWAQSRSIPVAHAGGYDNQFQFLGRLSHPLSVVYGDNSSYAWAKTHPQGLMVVYFEQEPHLPAGVRAVYSQPFRGDWLAILPAADVNAYLRVSSSMKPMQSSQTSNQQTTQTKIAVHRSTGQHHGAIQIAGARN